MLDHFVGAFAGSLIVSSIYWLMRQQRDGRIKRALRSVPARLVIELKDGQVGKIVGAVEPCGALLEAPFSGRKCSYYLAIVQERTGGGKSGKWAERCREERMHDFYLRDGSARALVRMQGATVAAVRDAKRRSHLFKDPDPPLREFLERYGVDPKGLLMPRNLRYLEAVIEPGETVTVGGLVRWELDPDPPADAKSAFREVPQRAFLQASEQMPLLVSDDPAAR